MSLLYLLHVPTYVERHRKLIHWSEWWEISSRWTWEISSRFLLLSYLVVMLREISNCLYCCHLRSLEIPFHANRSTILQQLEYLIIVYILGYRECLRTIRTGKVKKIENKNIFDLFNINIIKWYLSIGLLGWNIFFFSLWSEVTFVLERHTVYEYDYCTTIIWQLSVVI